MCTLLDTTFISWNTEGHAVSRHVYCSNPCSTDLSNSIKVLFQWLELTAKMKIFNLKSKIDWECIPPPLPFVYYVKRCTILRAFKAERSDSRDEGKEGFCRIRQFLKGTVVSD